MKLRDIINNIDKSNSIYINFEKLLDEFDLMGYGYIDHDPQERLKGYFYMQWYCTDQYVGGRAYFLDDKFVGISFQNARKSSENFSWSSREDYNKVKEYLQNLIISSNNEKHIDIIDMDIEMDTGFNVVYGEQLLTDTVIYNGIEVKVINKWRHMNDIDKWKQIKIQFSDGEKKIVDLNDVIVPFLIDKK